MNDQPKPVPASALDALQADMAAAGQPVSDADIARTVTAVRQIVRFGMTRFEVQRNGRRYAVAETMEDARLFEASPDLLSALKGFINPSGHTDACMSARSYATIPDYCLKKCKATRIAIARAEGTGW